MAAKKKGKKPVKKTVKKKPILRRRTTRLKNKKPIIFNELKKILVGTAILVSVCLTIAMIADLSFQPGHVEKKNDRAKTQPVKPEIEPIQEDISDVNRKKAVAGLKVKSDKSIRYEVFEDVDHTTIEKPALPGKVHMPQIAIIIDDIGYDKKIALALSDLNPDITFSILPFAPFGKVISEKLYAKGSQLMLHLPMEPVNYPDIDPGPGALLSSMSPDVLIDQLRKDIKEIAHIVGVNNHMGSKLTTHSAQMNQIFTILKKENLFFIDSRTAHRSQCRASARLLQLKFARRDVFLDNFQNTEYITGQFKKLIDLAEKHGSAIGIGHPYKATLETLSKELPRLKNKVKIVRASVLTAIPE